MSEATPHEDPIVRDLKAIRRLGWSKPERLADGLAMLPQHPAVVHKAAKPKGKAERVAALKQLLRMTKTRLKKREPKGTVQSVAVAATILLRLEPAYATGPVENLWGDVGTAWKMPGGTVRSHRAVKDIYEPFAAAFRELAAERAEKYGFEPSEDPDPDAYASGKEGQMRHRLRKLETELHEERLRAIDEGTVAIQDQEEMRKILFMLTELAEAKLRAVDYTPILLWTQSPLKDYLDFQLARVRERSLSLERIHVVADSQLKDPEKCALLNDFVERHREAEVTLLLCHEEAIKRLELRFNPYSGLVLVDEDEPLAVTGKIGDGSVGRAHAYVHETDEVRTLRRETDELRADIANNGSHEKVMRKLKRP